MNRKHVPMKKAEKPHERPHISKAALSVARANLKEFESKTNEAFLDRAEINRKLSSL